MRLATAALALGLTLHPLSTAGDAQTRLDLEPSFVNEGVIEAPSPTVWEVWSTAEGYRKLGVALADMEFRIGGLIRSRYRADGPLGDDQTIENRILAFEPGRMLAIQIARPPAGFPFKEAWKHTWTVITLTPLGSTRTHLRVASMGFASDPESTAMRRFFEAGNAATIKVLQDALAPRAGEPRPIP